MDLTLENGFPKWSMTPGDHLLTSAILCLTVARGDFFMDLEFGHRFRELHELTDKTIALAQQYAMESLTRLKTAGRVKTIAVAAVRHPYIHDAIKLSVSLTRPDQSNLDFELFVRVM